MKVRLLAPAGFTEQPSGGNVYDRHLGAGLAARGWEVVTQEVEPGDELSGEGLLLVDSLVTSWAAGRLLESDARVVPLVHMLFATPGERELFASAPAVVTTSGWTRRVLLADPAVDPRRIHVALPGAPRPETVRAGAGAERELLCVAAVVRAKGQDVLLNALGKLTDLDWRCTLVGPLDRDPDFVDELRKAAAGAGILDRVVFAGELGGADLRAAYEVSDLALLPTRGEAYGMVVTEALAHGLPVIASAVGGVPEALGEVDGAHPGMLVRAGDPDALARALRRWCEDATLRRWLRRAAARRAGSLPRWETTAARVATALEAALAEEPR